MASGSARYLRYILFAFFVSETLVTASCVPTLTFEKGHCHTLLYLDIFTANSQLAWNSR